MEKNLWKHEKKSSLYCGNCLLLTSPYSLVTLGLDIYKALNIQIIILGSTDYGGFG
jgi:hypothetical protein